MDDDQMRAVDATTEQYIAFLDRQAEVFADVRRASLARLGLEVGASVLDAGCGPGTDTLDINEPVGAAGRAVGVDANPGMVDIARQRAAARNSNAAFCTADVRSLPFSDGSFDVVRCVLLLLHVENPAQAVTEMARVLRPGGQLVCIDVDHQMDAVDATDVELAERVLRARFALVANPRVGRQLHGLLTGAGLEHVQTEVLTSTTTSWGEFNALGGEHRPTLFEHALLAGIASDAEVMGLEADLRERDATGRFFGCAVRMRSQGAKPETR